MSNAFMLFVRMTFCLFVLTTCIEGGTSPVGCTMENGTCACPVTFSCGADSSTLCTKTASDPTDIYYVNDGNRFSRMSFNNANGPCWIRYELDSPTLITGVILKGHDGLPTNSNHFLLYVGNDVNIPGTNQLCYSDAGSTTGVYSSYNEDWTHSYLNKSCNIVGKYLIAYSVETYRLVTELTWFGYANMPDNNNGQCNTCPENTVF